MKVTRVEEISKARSRVYIDEEFAFVLYKGELRLYHVREGEEVSKEDYRRILDEVLPRRAKLRAMNLLQRREYTVEGLRRKLQAGGYPEGVAQAALDYVASYHYTDDLRYALDYITSQEDRRSRMRIEQDLMKRGISRDTLGRAWEKWQEQGGEQNEQAMIEKLLRKRNFDADCALPRERQRTYAFLMRRGFSQEAVSRALRGQEW